MHKSKLLLSSLLALALAAPPAGATDWQDNAFSWWFSTAFAEPGIGSYSSTGAPTGDTNIQKNILTFTHVSGYKYGGNFLNIDLSYSSPKDPVNGLAGQGAVEVYAVYRHHLGLNSFIAGNPFAFGPVRDINLAAGVDLNSKNTTFASEKIMPMAGMEISFAVPGFLNLGVMAEKEWNTNGLPGANKPVVFNVTPFFTAAWNINLAGALSFEGFGTFNLPKGKDGFGDDTVSELLLHATITYDIGTLFDSKGYQIGVGYQYWLNKFGIDHTKLPGCVESAAFVEAAIHL